MGGKKRTLVGVRWMCECADPAGGGEMKGGGGGLKGGRNENVNKKGGWVGGKEKRKGWRWEELEEESCWNDSVKGR